MNAADRPAERVAAWRKTHPGEQITESTLLDLLNVPNLRGAYLRYANLRDADLGKANLWSADLLGADLRYANLRDADLWSAYLWGADLGGADLREANLRGAYLREASLRDANLWGADLRDADLRGANLWYTNLRRANLRGASLEGADLREAEGGVLQVAGLHRYQGVLVPTVTGWQLTIGCWSGTTDDLRTLIATDTGWPESTPEQARQRRPLLAALANLCDAHATNHTDALKAVQDKWGAA